MRNPALSRSLIHKAPNRTFKAQLYLPVAVSLYTEVNFNGINPTK